VARRRNFFVELSGFKKVLRWATAVKRKCMNFRARSSLAMMLLTGKEEEKRGDGRGIVRVA